MWLNLDVCHWGAFQNNTQIYTSVTFQVCIQMKGKSNTNTEKCSSIYSLLTQKQRYVFKQAYMIHSAFSPPKSTWSIAYEARVYYFIHTCTSQILNNYSALTYSPWWPRQKAAVSAMVHHDLMCIPNDNQQNQTGNERRIVKPY